MFPTLIDRIYLKSAHTWILWYIFVHIYLISTIYDKHQFNLWAIFHYTIWSSWGPFQNGSWAAFGPRAVVWTPLVYMFIVKHIVKLVLILVINIIITSAWSGSLSFSSAARVIASVSSVQSWSTWTSPPVPQSPTCHSKLSGVYGQHCVVHFHCIYNI